MVPGDESGTGLRSSALGSNAMLWVCRRFAHMPADNTPASVVVTRPNSRVAICAAHDSPGDLYLEPRTQRCDRNIASDSPDAQLLWLVIAESNETGSMRVEVPQLRRKIAIGPGEEEIVRKQLIEDRCIRVELSGAKARFKLDDLGIWRTNQDGFHDGDLSIHRGKQR